MRIIGFVRMRKHTARERRVNDVGQYFRTCYACLRLAAELRHVCDGLYAGRETRPGYHCCKRVEQMLLRRLESRRRQRLLCRTHDVLRNCSHDRGDGAARGLYCFVFCRRAGTAFRFTALRSGRYCSRKRGRNTAA